MKYYILHKNFYNKPVCLSPNQVSNPMAVMQSFYTNYHLAEVRQLLWEQLEAALTAQNSAFDEATDRESLMVFHTQLIELLEAAWLIQAGSSGQSLQPP